MYEPEKILVQNAGIDPGVAALLQNANKGNMDPAALMAMMNNGGFGGNGGWWWIWIILIFFCWGGFGGNGFGRGSDDASRLASQLNTDTNTYQKFQEHLKRLLFIVLVPLLRFQILTMKLCRKVSFQYQDRTDVNQSMYLLVVMENLRNYQYQLNVQ